MRNLFVAAGLAVLVAGCAAGPGTPSERFFRSLGTQANPSAVIATELAFAREAREKGQWTAFRKFATGDAVMFVPEAVNAREWLSGQTDAPQPVEWQPHQVWASCDGSLSVTKGAWQRPDGSVGYFTTIWERQGRPGDKEEYRWVLDQGDVLAESLPEPEMIRTMVADCSEPGTAGGATFETKPMAGRGAGRSDDRTLTYEWVTYQDGSRELSVFMLTPEGMVEVLNFKVSAPTGQ